MQKSLFACIIKFLTSFKQAIKNNHIEKLCYETILEMSKNIIINCKEKARGFGNETVLLLLIKSLRNLVFNGINAKCKGFIEGLEDLFKNTIELKEITVNMLRILCRLSENESMGKKLRFSQI